MANAHRSRNSFSSIRINEHRLEEDSEIKADLVGAFQCLLTASCRWRPSFPELPFNSIEVEQALKLEERFIKEEVWPAIFGLNGDKALGLDDFPMAF